MTTAPATMLERLASVLADRYIVEREIGAGGMATVFLAHDVRHDRRVALKVLHPDLAATIGSERFLAEIRTTAGLQHPHILPLHDSGNADGLLFYVMPFVEGETLRDRLTRDTQLPIADALRLAREVASALDYAHRNNVIHRDIKPENILLHEGSAIVADFGIALAVQSAGGSRMTQTGLSLGTPQYMAPEQAMGDRAITAQADVYALGAVTYEMLTGEPPFTGANVQAVLAKVMSAEVEPVRRVRRNVPEHVEHAVNRALEKLPADRFATAAEFSAALGGQSDGASQYLPVSHSATSNVRGWKFATIAMSALFATGALYAGWSLTRTTPTRQVLRYVMAFDPDEALSGSFGRTALSPDGSVLVYTNGPNQELRVRHRNSLHGELLGGTAGAASPFFSPDGDKIAFITDAKTLKIVSLTGGPPIVVSDSLVGLAGGSWSRNGFIYIDGIGATPLVRVAAKQGAVPAYFTTLDSASDEVNHAWAEVLPNGKGVLFQVRYSGKKSGQRAIAIADAKTGKHRVLMRGLLARYSPSGHLVYATEDGTLMSVPFDQDAMTVTGEATALSTRIRISGSEGADISISSTGTLMYLTGASVAKRALVWVKRDGTQQEVDTTWRENFGDLELSPDGSQLAASVGEVGASNIWIKQMDKGANSRLSIDGGSLSPAWTPDGKSVTFRSPISNRLFMRRADGSAQPDSLHIPAAYEGVWSPDGTWLVYRVRNGQSDLYARHQGADTTTIRIAATSFTESYATFSPDGKFLAYVSDESGREEVYVVPFPNVHDTRWVVSSRGGYEPRWKNGSELFFRDAEGNIVAVSVTESPAFAVKSLTTLFRWPSWRIVASAGNRLYDVSRDGSRFLMSREMSSGSDDQLVFVENWIDEVRAKKRE